MADKDTRIQAKEKQEKAGAAEPTRPGPVFTPEVDIFEKETEIVLLADMPGVTAETLSVDLDRDLLTITGDVPAPADAGQSELLTEYLTGRYYRQFTIGDVVDRGRIEARLSDGVMRLTLPKVEAAKPRKIQVKEG